MRGSVPRPRRSPSGREPCPGDGLGIWLIIRVAIAIRRHYPGHLWRPPFNGLTMFAQRRLGERPPGIETSSVLNPLLPTVEIRTASWTPRRRDENAHALAQTDWQLSRCRQGRYQIPRRFHLQPSHRQRIGNGAGETEPFFPHATGHVDRNRHGTVRGTHHSSLQYRYRH